MGSTQFYVITGASGGGKSTLIQALGKQGFSIAEEVALSLLQESGRELLLRTDLQAFMNEVVERNIRAYDLAKKLPPPVFFDRGIPECLEHMRFLGLDVDPSYVARSVTRRYADTVFVAEPWSEIYVCNQWRTAPFERAARSFDATVAPYVDGGYTACVLPKVSVAERLAFVLAEVSARNDC